MSSLHRSGSLTTVVRELAKYKLHLVGVQEIMWDKGGTARAGDYTSSLRQTCLLLYMGVKLGISH